MVKPHFHIFISSVVYYPSFSYSSNTKLKLSIFLIFVSTMATPMDQGRPEQKCHNSILCTPTKCSVF